MSHNYGVSSQKLKKQQQWWYDKVILHWQVYHSFRTCIFGVVSKQDVFLTEVFHLELFPFTKLLFLGWKQNMIICKTCFYSRLHHNHNSSTKILSYQQKPHSQVKVLWKTDEKIQVRFSWKLHNPGSDKGSSSCAWVVFTKMPLNSWQAN